MGHSRWAKDLLIPQLLAIDTRNSFNIDPSQSTYHFCAYTCGFEYFNFGLKTGASVLSVWTGWGFEKLTVSSIWLAINNLKRRLC